MSKKKEIGLMKSFDSTLETASRGFLNFRKLSVQS